MIKSQIISSLEHVEDELFLLGIPREHLIESVKRGYAARSNATENDPPSTAGNNAFTAIVRAIRELFLPDGWERVNKHNLCFTVNAERKIAIVVSSGNCNTGISDSEPQTKNPKGEQYKLLTADNRDIFEIEPKIQSILFPDFQTFVLLYHYDTKKKEMRLELSVPVEMDTHGYVNKWHKRIILQAISFDVEQVFSVDQFFDDLQDIDIPVKRRQQ